MSATTTSDATTTPEDDDGADSPTEPHCPHCGRAFARAAYRDLHLGLEHDAELNDDQRAAYESARAEEEQALRLFRYKAIGLLVLVYFGFLMLYAFSL
jgi:hypothetical protein